MYMQKERPLILISNDDGYTAKGVNDLAEMASSFGDVIVVAPDKGRSGSAMAITSSEPVEWSWCVKVIILKFIVVQELQLIV